MTCGRFAAFCILFLETGGILFREYCFGEENSLSLTEFYGKLGELCEKKTGEFALAHKQKLVGAKGGGRRMRGNWGMNSWKIVVHGRCAGSL